MLTMIVDNDHWVLSGISRLLETSDLDLEIHCFDNAQDAIAFALKHRPPLVIADVEMPGCNGLEMCNKLRNEYNPRLVIISAYDRFQYAQQAISLGVIHYVLKPIRQNEFLDVIRKAIEIIEIEDESKAKQTKIMETKFFLDIASGRMNSVAVDEYIQLIEPQIKSQSVSLCLMHIENHAMLVSMMQKNPMKTTSQNNYIIEEAIKECPTSVSFYEIRHGYYLFMIFGNHSKFIEWINGIFQLAKDNDCIASAGISQKTNDKAKFRDLYNQAVRALQREFTDGSGKVYYYSGNQSDYLVSKKYDLVHLHSYSTLITNSMVFSASFSCPNNEIDDLFDYIRKSNIKQNDACLFCKELLLLISMELMYIMESKPSEFHSLYEENLQSSRTLSELKTRFEACIEDIYKNIHKKMMTKSDSVKLVVDKMLRDDCGLVSLDTVADKLNIHPTYLSILFKETVGVNFKTYVLEYKINKAMQMLVTTDIPVYSISDKLGYMDVTHFSRVFKKQAGMTPGEYRQHASQKT
ncbi:MAG TPA: response regulator [Clostridiaceae bacterium]|nr:response regulator [Clostridiaceae bacterium]